jgi:hypothetical protein
MEHLKKYCSHSERGFLSSSEASAKEQAQVVLQLSRNDLSAVALAKAEARTQKDRSLFCLVEWLQCF